MTTWQRGSEVPVLHSRNPLVPEEGRTTVDFDLCEKCGKPHVRQLKNGELRATCVGHLARLKGDDGKPLPDAPWEPCMNWPLRGSPVCAQRHGGRTKQGRASAAAALEESHARELLAQRLQGAREIRHPVYALLDLAAEMTEWKEVLRERLDELSSLSTTDRLGVERERAVVLLYERSLERLGRLLVDLQKLNLEQRKLVIGQSDAKKVMNAVLVALQKTGLGQHEMSFRHELKLALHDAQVEGSPTPVP